MGRVISGKYEGGNIKFKIRPQCLLINYQGKVIPLDAMRVKEYAFRHVERNPLLPWKKVYVIKWRDGGASVIGIDSSDETYLAAGCETAEIDNDEADKCAKKADRRNNAVIILVSIVIAAFLCYLLSQATGGSSSTAGDSNKSHGTYAEWDSELGVKKPDADVLIIPDQAVGVEEQGWGLIGGTALNNSQNVYHHFEAVYGLYLPGSDGATGRFGTCTFMRDNIEFYPQQNYEYSATCDAWINGAIYRLESVGFH